MEKVINGYKFTPIPFTCPECGAIDDCTFTWKESNRSIQQRCKCGKWVGCCKYDPRSISEKIERLNEVHQDPVTVEAPSIAASQLVKRCTNSKTRIQITNNVPNAVVYYTTDGEEPSQNSKSGLAISIDSGFNNSRKKEPDKIVIVKVKAVLNGVSSRTNTYEVTLQKDIERWTGIEI